MFPSLPGLAGRCSFVKTADRDFTQRSITSRRRYLRIHQATPVLNSSSLKRSVPQQPARSSALPQLSRPPNHCLCSRARPLHGDQDLARRYNTLLYSGRGEGHTKKSCRQMAAHPKQHLEGMVFGHAFPSVWGSWDKAVASHRRERTRTSFPPSWTGEKEGGLRGRGGSRRARRPPGRQRGHLPTWSSILSGLRSRMLAGMVLSISSSTLCKEAAAQHC